MKRIKIGTKYVGSDEPCLIMLDAGVNHNNDVERAKLLIRKAKEAGADVIKFQTYKAETITTKKAPRYWNSKLDTDGGGTQFDTFSKIDDLPLEAYSEMKKLCEELDIIFSSTPFNLTDVEFLAKLDLAVYKVSSSDIVYSQLIKEVASIGKPVILSTGTASLGEIEDAVSTIAATGNNQIILQHCILSYPCDDKDANLAKMVKLQELFPEIPVGYSDHTYGIPVPVTAVALGAKSIEKHYTIDKSLPDSPDHGFALDTDEVKEMVHFIRRVEKSIGSFNHAHYEAEHKAFLYARKSIVANCSIPKGTKITEDMLTCKRPGTGISPKNIEFVIGATAQEYIPEDTTITLDLIR